MVVVVRTIHAYAQLALRDHISPFFLVVLQEEITLVINGTCISSSYPPFCSCNIGFFGSTCNTNRHWQPEIGCELKLGYICSNHGICTEKKMRKRNADRQNFQTNQTQFSNTANNYNLNSYIAESNYDTGA